MCDYERADWRSRFNWLWHDLGAAIGRSRLRRLNEENAWRRQTAMLYNQARPGHVSIQAPSVPAHERGWYRYVLRFEDAEQVGLAMSRLASAGIETIVPLRTDELLGYPQRCPNAAAIAKTTLSLPIWPGMTHEQTHRVADALAGA